MQIIPVIDLLRGRVVRGIGGRRSEYQPIQSQSAADARPSTVARAFVKHFAFKTAYVADLDAITTGHFSANAWQEIAAAGLNLWLDAGITNSLAAQKIIACGKQLDIDFQHVVGLETLESASELETIQKLSRGEVIFSLDLRAGQPLTQIEDWKSLPPIDIAAQAISRGTNRLIILDLADVGESSGTRTL